MRNFIVLTCLAFVAVLGAGATLMPGTSRAPQIYSKDAGYFYRFTAGFEVKETGERLDFDYVVACNIRLTRWRDDGLSDDGTFSPRIMVKVTADGHAVMLQALEACHGLTSENGDVPSDVLPLAVWFEDVADLSNGIGYVSEDAYDNPLGKLRFRGARVDRATREDWEAWRKKSAADYVERGALPGPWGYNTFNRSGSSRADIARYVSECRGYSRVKLPDSMREKLRGFWPSGRPRFWTVPDRHDSDIRQVISDKKLWPRGTKPWGSSLGSPSGSGSSGLPIRSGRTVSRAPHGKDRWPSETYPFVFPPVVSASPLTVAPSSPDAQAYVLKLEFREGALNGFAGCQNLNDARGLTIRNTDPARRLLFAVDEVTVREIWDGNAMMVRPAFVMERDEYVFIQFSVIL